MPPYFLNASQPSSGGACGFKDVRPACATADLTPVLKFARNQSSRSFTMRAFARWLSHQHATLPIAYQADIAILPIFACTFAPGASFWSIQIWAIWRYLPG